MTHLRPQQAVASFDSASALLLGLSRALQGRDFPHLGQSALQAVLVRASAALPPGLRRRTYALASGREGVAPDRLDEIDLQQVAGWVTEHYTAQRFPAVLVGSSNGALIHLAAACRIPWLPQTLLVPVRRPHADPADALAALDFGARHARSLLDRNPGVELHHMHDANQDELSASQMAYFRVKWHTLPRAYERFLDERLEPGAPVIVVHDQSHWPVTRVGDRHVFQLGARGGMTAEEYLASPDAPAATESAVEAEWGFADPLLDRLRDWLQRGGHRHPLVETSYAHPQQPAAAVADVFRDWLRRRGEDAQRLLVSSFIVHDPWRTVASASVPYWTYFPTQDAARDLAHYLDRTSFDEVDVLLFNHGVESRGLADGRTWEQLAACGRSGGRLVGVDPRRFPADFASFARYGPALRRLPDASQPQPLPVAEALTALAETGVRVEWLEGGADR